MNKKLYTLLFILVSTIINVLATIIIIAGLCSIDVLIMRKLLKIEAGTNAFGSSLMVCFVLGLALSFFFYTRISTKIIKKFHMDKKFEDKWLDHSGPRQGFRRKKAAKEEEGYTYSEDSDGSTRKTKLPSSVLPSEEEKEEAERWGE